MTALRRRRREDLPLRGLAPTTQPGSLEAVNHVAQPYRQAPDQISEEAIRQSFLDVINEQQVADIAPPRMLVRVRQGQGGKDRLVPLAERTLERWRAYWQGTRPRLWWFTARPPQTPLPPTTLQKTCTRVVRQRGSAQDASIHTLRHAYATHLVEGGVSRRVMQERLGHQRPRTTARSTPLTTNTFDSVPATINTLMAAL